MLDEMGLITFQEQIEEYPPIKELLLKATRNPPLLVDPGKPWRIYGQKRSGGKWGRKDFVTYREAFAFLKPRLKTYHDISITSKRLRFNPPGRVVRIKRQGKPVMIQSPSGLHQKTKIVPVSPPPGHLWCMYCRRFTIFVWFTSHHAFEGQYKDMLDFSTRRCCICGGREAFAAWRR